MSVLKIKNQYGNWARVPVVDGKDGISILSGKSIPSNSMGNDEDLYLNLNNGDIYKKTNGVWIEYLNIKGKDGVDGVDGEKGEKGENGRDLVEGLTFKRDYNNNIWAQW